jgi:hypothetical protein
MLQTGRDAANGLQGRVRRCGASPEGSLKSFGVGTHAKRTTRARARVTGGNSAQMFAQ